MHAEAVAVAVASATSEMNASAVMNDEMLLPMHAQPSSAVAIAETCAATVVLAKASEETETEAQRNASSSSDVHSTIAVAVACIHIVPCLGSLGPLVAHGSNKQDVHSLWTASMQTQALPGRQHTARSIQLVSVECRGPA